MDVVQGTIALLLLDAAGVTTSFIALKGYFSVLQSLRSLLAPPHVVRPQVPRCGAISLSDQSQDLGSLRLIVQSPITRS